MHERNTLFLLKILIPIEHDEVHASSSFAFWLLYIKDLV
jgi:hypothetical protein